jgi:hypothetical protein
LDRRLGGPTLYRIKELIKAARVQRAIEYRAIERKNAIGYLIAEKAIPYQK